MNSAQSPFNGCTPLLVSNLHQNFFSQLLTYAIVL